MITMGDQREWVSVQLCSLVCIIWERSFSLWVQGRSYPKTCFCWTSMSGVGTFNYVTFDLQPKNGLEHWTRSTFFCCTKASKPDACVSGIPLISGCSKIETIRRAKSLWSSAQLGLQGWQKSLCNALRPMEQQRQRSNVLIPCNLDAPIPLSKDVCGFSRRFRVLLLEGWVKWEFEVRWCHWIGSSFEGI